MAWQSPPAMRLRVISTGAANTKFLVVTAAETAGLSEVINAKSSLSVDGFLTPAATALKL